MICHDTISQAEISDDTFFLIVFTHVPFTFIVDTPVFVLLVFIDISDPVESWKFGIVAI